MPLRLGALQQPLFAFRRPIRLHRRTMIAAPGQNSSPLLTRRSDRKLPDPYRHRKIWAVTFPIFIVIITLSALAIFNYEKSESSVVKSILYALRTSEIGRKELGSEIYFRDRFPWIWGEINKMHGKVDVQFAVKGSKGRGMVTFKSFRRSRQGFVSLLDLDRLVLLNEGHISSGPRNGA